MAGPPPTLSNRALNRALLARNLLLERQPLSTTRAVEHLIGLQAQEPLEPYTGLWSRLVGFDPAQLGRLLEDRKVVRTLLMRRTLHLVSAADCLRLRPLHQPMLEGRMRATLGRRLEGVDLERLAAAGRAVFEAGPATLPEAGRAVGHAWPDAAARDLGDALSSLVELVQVPPRGVWGRQGPARNTTIAAWLGRVPDAPPGTLDELVRRYLRAFGPAASADVRAWSGLAGLRPVLDRLGPELRRFRDERGRLLFDVADGPLPDPDLPVPPRFLPAFDNAVLAYDDRSRIIDAADRGLSVAGARVALVDGRVAATWTVGRADEGRRSGAGRLLITLLRPLAAAEEAALVEEGERLAAFLLRVPSADTDTVEVRLTGPAR